MCTPARAALLLLFTTACSTGVEEATALDPIEGKRTSIPERPLERPAPDPEVAEPEKAEVDAASQACFRELIEIEAAILATAGEVRALAPCRSDEECTIVELSISCLEMCPHALSRSIAGDFQKRLAELDEALCREPRDCHMAPLCPSMERAACIRGRCYPDLGSQLSGGKDR